MTVLKYCLFAMIATTVNLATQFIAFDFYKGYGSLYLGILLGTASGLVCKYVLDKKYVFNYQSNNSTEELRNFSVYSVFGILTTLIFWSFEILFDAMSENPHARYIGAIIGLCLGYIIKYQLDKKFVFKRIDNSSKFTGVSK